MKLSDAINFFIKTKQLEGLKHKSIENYKMFLNYFLKSIGDINLKDLSYTQIDDYQFKLLERNLSRATIATYNRHLKSFFRFIEKQPLIRKHLNKIIYKKDHQLFSEQIKVCKSPTRRCLILNPKEIKTVFGVAKQIYTEPLRTRNLLILALMLDCGLRQQEVINLTYGRINLKDKLINVYGKGSKERIVPFGKYTQTLLIKYINQCRCRHSNDKKRPLLYTATGLPINNNIIKLMVNKLSKISNIKFSSHTLRHNFATNWCIDEYNRCKTIDIYRLKLLMGHEDLKTTFKYLHMAEEIIISQNHISHLDYIGIC